MIDSTTQQQDIVKTETTEILSLSQWLSLNISVVAKLIIFTVALFALPILTYFYSIDTVFDGNTTYAAGAAAFMANIVVIAYVITAFFERPHEDKQAKKD